MLIERRDDGPRSVFMLNDTPSMWDCPSRYDEYWQESSGLFSSEGWRFGNYKNAEAARSAMQSGTPNKTALDAYEQARTKLAESADAFHVRSIRRHRVYGEAGDEVDVDRWMTGHTQPWGSIRRAAKNRTLTVGFMLWMSCGNADNDFAANVASGVALAESLTAAGYMVRIVGVHTAHIGDDDGECGVVHPLVEFGQPIDEHALMAWGQPAACRHLGFTWMHHLYQSGDMGRGTQTTDAWLRLAGVDVFMAKQWSGGQQKAHIAKVLERIEREAA